MLGFLKKTAPIIMLLALSFWAVRPLLHAGYFSMHDDQQVARLYEMDQALTAGQFPIRWVADLGFGFGYPLFNFYPPLVYYLGEIYHLLGLGFIDAVKLVWATALLGSGIAMYLLAKELFGRVGGIVAGLFYIYAPYHAVDAYVRGALAELFSFVWLPLVLWATCKKRPVLVGIFLALLMVTHNLIFMPFMVFFMIWALFYDRRSLCLSPIIALALTAFFWLPAIFEKQYTLVDQVLVKNLASYKIHFVCWPQLLSSPWGYGGSVAGCSDGLSFIVGRLHLLMAAVGLATGLYFWRRRLEIRVLILAAGLFALAIFMTTELSRFVWDKVTPLWYLQFPWRFLGFAALFGSFMAGAVIGLLPKSSGRLVLAGVIIGGLIFVNAKYFQPQKYLAAATDRSLITSDYLRWEVSSSSFEFMPRGMATYINSSGVVWPKITPETVGNQSFRPGSFEFQGYSAQGEMIQIQQTNFPGWQVWVDGKNVAITDNNNLKLITFWLPAGKHRVVGRFTDTPVRAIGNLVSLGGIILVGGCFLYGARRDKT